MVYVLIITNNFEKWIEKFKRNLYLDFEVHGYIRKFNKNTFNIRNELFNIEITSYCGDNLRGKAPGVIIIDKPMRCEDINLYLRPLLGHGGSVRYGNEFIPVDD